MKKIKNGYRNLQKKLRIVNLSDFEYILKDDIEKRLKAIEEETITNKKNFEELKKQCEDEYKKNNAKLSTIKDDTDSEFRKIKNDNYRVERDLFQCFQNLEYKVYEFNKYSNQILYKNQLEINELKGITKKDFNPKVSIIIPAYNASKYLNEAIDSALNQTYGNIEIIVVNDGSKDDGKTEKIAKSYGNRIKYFEKENGGVSSALNYGIKNMTGDYFTWLSHDDRYYNNNVEEHINFLRHIKETNVITFTNFDIIDEDSKVLIKETIGANLYCFDYKINQIHQEYSLLQGEINGGSIMIPKEAFEECGIFDETLRIAQERDMWFRLMKKYTFCNIPIETTSIRFHKEQVTNTNEKVLKETNEKRLEIIEKMSIETKERLEHSENNFYRIMSNYYKMNGLMDLKEKMDEYEKRDVE